MKHTAERKESRLLFACSEPRSTAHADIDILAIIMTNHVWLRCTLGKTDHSYAVMIIDVNLFVEGENHRMDLAPENGIHDPMFEIVSLDTGNSSVVFYSQ